MPSSNAATPAVTATHAAISEATHPSRMSEAHALDQYVTGLTLEATSIQPCNFPRGTLVFGDRKSSGEEQVRRHARTVCALRLRSAMSTALAPYATGPRTRRANEHQAAEDGRLHPHAERDADDEDGRRGDEVAQEVGAEPAAEARASRGIGATSSLSK